MNGEDGGDVAVQSDLLDQAIEIYTRVERGDRPRKETMWAKTAMNLARLSAALFLSFFGQAPILYCNNEITVLIK
ncbi:hypothetical protein DM860_007315 [Cuscuta australis]|uniref:Uncharacterized protein n=1 Tax=Cuscuta australis TaxID=267555 RepID=A0A328E729_9ASTE|nr:hypothetical protein DM860_007315 [Cuscuta australis]